AADAGDDSVRLPQALDEPCHDDDPPAAPFEEVGGLVEPLLGQEDIAAEALDQRPPSEVADREADVVARDGGQESQQAYEPDAEPARAGVDRPQDEDRLPRYRNPEILEQHETGH